MPPVDNIPAALQKNASIVGPHLCSTLYITCRISLSLEQSVLSHNTLTSFDDEEADLISFMRSELLSSVSM